MAAYDPGCKLAVCAVFKDEAPYLAEWIEFHRLVGVERFFLYDNNSSDDPRPILAPWIRAGAVTLTPWPIGYRDNWQTRAYADCLERQRGAVRWLAFLDLDEFLFSPTGAPLPEALRPYEGCPGVVVNWQCYGSSGLIEQGEGLVIERFVRRAQTDWIRNRRGKSIVDPRWAIRPHGPHYFTYAGGELAVTENFDPVRVVERSARWLPLLRQVARLPIALVNPMGTRHSTVRTVSVDRLRINHYVVKSRSEYRKKAALYPQGDSKVRGLAGDKSIYLKMHDRNNVLDPILASVAPEVRKRIADVKA